MKISLRSVIPAVLAFVLMTVFTASFDYRQALAQNAPASKDSRKTAERTQTGQNEILVTFVEIGAARCIPCKAMQPIMKAVAEEYRGKVLVVFHDVWTQQGRLDAEKYNIRMIPTQVFLDREGKEYYRHEGYFPKVDVVRVLQMQGVR
jgi:thioredoxin 1